MLFSPILVAATAFGTSWAFNNSFNIKPFTINLSSKIPRLNALVNSTRLPRKPLYPGVGSDKGIELEFLSELQTEWLGSPTFDWETQQAELNRFNLYTAEIETQTVHFIHQKSTDPDAIPVILLHGWPGSFQEFAPVIKPLTEPWTSSTGRKVSYNVVVPSLPGFVFSSAPPNANWTVDDTARIFNELMTEVLGYPTYALHGTDWGSVVAYALYSGYNTSVRAGHFVFLPFFPPSAQEIAANNITLSAVQKVTEQRGTDFISNESTIDFGDLTGSDPRAGTPPSVLNNTAILTSISLYYLTASFLSSVWIYSQNPGGFNPVYSKAATDAPMLFGQYEYNIALWPEEYVAQVGNLVSYKGADVAFDANADTNRGTYAVHDFGGHFPGLDNPPSLIEDIREMGLYFTA
ncbi:Alpha/Beta hydrolase protein [Mycena galericulata]|nr:Alpha/Beta hydrolase protein [Mycena galericulata]